MADDKIRSYEFTCDEAEKAILHLKTAFPYIQIQEEHKEYKLRGYTVTILIKIKHGKDD